MVETFPGSTNYARSDRAQRAAPGGATTVGLARTTPGSHRAHERGRIWLLGFQPDFSWIDLPVIAEGATGPEHDRGVVADVPGLYSIGLKFLYAVSSEQIHGVGRDAAHIAAAIVAQRDHGNRGRAATNRQNQLEHA